LGLILAVLVLLPALLLWLAGSPMAYAQAKSNPTSYTITDLGTLGGTFSQGQYVNANGAVSGKSTLPGDTVLVKLILPRRNSSWLAREFAYPR